MKGQSFFSILFIIISNFQLRAQEKPYYHFMAKENSTTANGNAGFNGNTTPNSTGNSGTGSNINVVYHRINWAIDPNSVTKTITGTIVTYFTTLVANVATLSFDLNKASFNNASLVVTYHGTGCTFSFPASGNVNILNINLTSTIAAANTLDSITIDYSGIPPAVSGAAQGYQVGGSGINKYVTTLSESYEDRDWWPCKADMQDKIDSMDINVTVPWVVATADTFWVATNGIIIDSTITGNNRTFKYKTLYPVASYLVFVSVAKFTRYYNAVNINGTNVQVAYYLLRNTANQANIVTAMDKINLVVAAFSSVFGDYPFKLEKHGFYDGLLGAGGMEHQTFSGIATGSLTSLRTLSHELMHQWFGDNVTFATWNDLWLAEGFARYSEALAAELVPSLGYSAYTTRSGIKTSALALNSASAWIPNANAGSSAAIWNSNYGSTIYQRGGMVVSMLRTLSGDTKFSEALTKYQTNLEGSSATTDSVKNYFNTVLGTDISGFFNDYIGGSGPGVTAVGGVGNPINTINWNTPLPNTLLVQVGGQTQSAGSNVPYFNGPVVLHATNAASGWTKDTTIVFYDWGGGNLSYAGNGLSAPHAGNLLGYTLSFTPTNVFYDDSARTLSTGITTKLGTLAVDFTNLSAFPGNSNVKVVWTVSNNADAKEFEIERSINGYSFSKIGSQMPRTANGNTTTYSWLDLFPLTGDNFYRIRSVGISGEIKYSNVVKVNMGKAKPIIIVYPNPVTNKQFFVQLTGMEKGSYRLKLVNGLGQVLLTRSFNYAGSAEPETILTGGIAPGVYYLEIIKPDLTRSISRLIVAVR